MNKKIGTVALSFISGPQIAYTINRLLKWDIKYGRDDLYLDFTLDPGYVLSAF